MTFLAYEYTDTRFNVHPTRVSMLRKASACFTCVCDLCFLSIHYLGLSSIYVRAMQQAITHRNRNKKNNHAKT